MNSKTYERAYETVREATRQFSEARKAYRAHEIDDANFLAARKLYKIAEADFDAAYAAEQGNQS